ncbi:hypothetical protein EVAR_49613_1 [Eumeta japonica]|uniref:Uncharacterized protein n=1 Tax=Eumeta variegata TaxID=151549 RepID=A0A4C1Y0B2_EUMVA|nr:hypothetical protein EVAR_49613_1 [Eumeta japonica]
MTPRKYFWPSMNADIAITRSPNKHIHRQFEANLPATRPLEENTDIPTRNILPRVNIQTPDHDPVISPNNTTLLKRTRSGRIIKPPNYGTSAEVASYRLNAASHTSSPHQSTLRVPLRCATARRGVRQPSDEAKRRRVYLKHDVRVRSVMCPMSAAGAETN